MNKLKVTLLQETTQGDKHVVFDQENSVRYLFWMYNKIFQSGQVYNWLYTVTNNNPAWKLTLERDIFQNITSNCKRKMCFGFYIKVILNCKSKGSLLGTFLAKMLAVKQHWVCSIHSRNFFFAFENTFSFHCQLHLHLNVEKGVFKTKKDFNWVTFASGE